MIYLIKVGASTQVKQIILDIKYTEVLFMVEFMQFYCIYSLL